MENKSEKTKTEVFKTRPPPRGNGRFWHFEWWIVFIQKQKTPAVSWLGLFRCGWAADYFPTVPRSIIAAAGLNFSVRDGKRCAPAPVPPLVSLAAFPGRGKGTHMSGTAGAAPQAQALGPLVPLGSTCRHAHTCGLSTSSSATALKGGLISGRASRLDAFSAYPLRTRLPGCAAGATTGTPLVRPTRSSRTKVRTPQASNARNR